MHQVQGYTKRVASVTKAMCRSRIGRFVGTEIWLNGFGAAPNLRLSVLFPLVYRSDMGIEGKRKNPY